MPPPPLSGSRQRFRRRRLCAVGAAAAPAGALAATSLLLLAPDELATLRLFGVSLAWWTAVMMLTLVLGVLAFAGHRTHAPTTEPPA